jgi:hypothetical protein
MLLLTDDGVLPKRCPRFGVERIPREIEGASRTARSRLRTGVYLEDGRAQAEDVRFLRRTTENSWITLTLREVDTTSQRMCLAAGHPVKLRRFLPSGTRPARAGDQAADPGRSRSCAAAGKGRGKPGEPPGRPGGRRTGPCGDAAAARACVGRALHRELSASELGLLGPLAPVPLLLAERARRPFIVSWLTGWAAFWRRLVGLLRDGALRGIPLWSPCR